MKRIFLILLAVAISAPSISLAADKAEPAVRVVGLSVAKADPNDKFGQSLARMLQSGTQVFLRYADPSKRFIKLETDVSKIETFKDDKDTDMNKDLKTSKGFTRRAGFGSFPKISPDGKSVGFAITSPNCPAPGAKELVLAGTVTLVAAKSVKTEEQKAVSLEKGSKVTIGPAPFEIVEAKDMKPDNWSKMLFTMTFQTGKSVDSIKKISFLDEAGKEIKSRRAGRISMGVTGKRTHKFEYQLEKKHKTATLKIEYYEGLERVSVPIDLRTGVGI
jgi:hypothetical protein